MLKRAAFALLAAAMPIVGLAASATEPNTAPNAAESGTYVVDPHHTQVGFSVLHMGFSFYSGRFSNVSGELELAAKKPAESRVRVSVPVASVSTTSAKLDSELKAADWLDATAYPTMTFTSTTVTPGAKGEAKVAGELSLHGITKPVVFKARFIGSGLNPLDKKYTAGFEISGDIKRGDFGVKKYIPLIGDTIHLSINAAFEKK